MSFMIMYDPVITAIVEPRISSGIGFLWVYAYGESREQNWIHFDVR